MKKKPFVIIGVVIAVLVVIVLALPFLIDANQFKPTLETDLSAALGRKVQIGNIQLSILSGGVQIDNVSIADDPAFSRSPFLKAKQLTAGVALIPLIFSKKIEVSSFTIADPEVSLLRSGSGTWNFSSLAGSGSKRPSKGSNDVSGTANFSVEKLKITNGTITVGTTGARGKTQVYTDVNLEASNLSYTSQFPFQLTAKTPGNGSAKVEGKAGPINQTDASLTPLDAKIGVKGLNLASTGFVDPSSGIAGLTDFSGNLTSNGRQMSSKGTLKADKIKLAPAGAPSSVPVNVDYATDYDLKREAGTLKQGDVRVGKALARLTGTYDTAGAQTTVQMKLTGQGMSVPDVEGMLPAVGITLPSGASLQSGTLDANLAISGPVDKLVITGPVNLSNAKMKGFSLASQLKALSAFTGLGGGGGSDTEIQTLSTNLRVDPSETRADNINLLVAGIGAITGNGTISSGGQLHCKMLAKVGGSSGAGGLLGSALSSLGGGGNSQGSGIPFTIQGTTSHPVFIPDVTGVINSVVKSRAGAPTNNPIGDASGILGGLFGKKKQP